MRCSQKSAHDSRVNLKIDSAILFSGVFMAWTTTQLTQVEEAIIATAAGAEEVEINGKRYRKPKMSELTKLRDQMKAELQADDDGGVLHVAFVDKSGI